jgi:hypothetical protein
MKSGWIGVTAALLVATAQAANWQFVIGSSDGNSFFEIDVGSIAKVDGATRKAWYRESLIKAQRVSASTPLYKEIKVLTHFRCAERTSANAQFIYYSETGNVVYSSVTAREDMSFADVIPDSVGEAMLNAVCAPGGKAAP